MNTIRKLLTDPENRRALPLFMVGATVGVARVIVYPFIQDQQQRVRHVSEAAIHYWRSDAPE
jgi:Mg2+/citrate symporter